jgi:hypothetical protein
MLENWPQELQIGFLNLLVSFFSLVTNTRSESSAFISNLGQIEKVFPISALTHSVKPLRLNSTFAPIGMLDLS